MPFYLIGARGRLGQAILEEYADSGIVSLDRSIYEHWSKPGAQNLVSRYFDQRLSGESTVFVASGLLDPNSSHEALFRVNYNLPKNVIDGAAKLGIKVITFGTVMEGLLRSKNPYIQTKAALGEYVKVMAARGTPAFHIQIHTLYGRGQPSPFMFLGQLLTAIRTNALFKMTSGRQLREYHHLADEAKAIRQIAKSVIQPGVLSLSHGKPLSLKTLAESVLQSFGKASLLRLGALPEPPEENYENIFKPIASVRDIEFRDPLPAVIEYLRELPSCQEVL